MIINKNFNIKIKGEKYISDILHSSIYNYMKNYCNKCDIEVLGEIDKSRIDGDTILFRGTYEYSDYDTKNINGSINLITKDNEINIIIHKMEDMRLYKSPLIY